MLNLHQHAPNEKYAIPNWGPYFVGEDFSRWSNLGAMARDVPSSTLGGVLKDMPLAIKKHRLRSYIWRKCRLWMWLKSPKFFCGDFKQGCL